jgi:hypothetical protein
VPTPMTDEELEAARASAKEVDTFEFRNEDDENDFIVAVLLKDDIGHFRVIEHSGMNSVPSGAGNIGERLTPEEVKRWTTFD